MIYWIIGIVYFCARHYWYGVRSAVDYGFLPFLLRILDRVAAGRRHGDWLLSQYCCRFVKAARKRKPVLIARGNRKGTGGGKRIAPPQVGVLASRARRRPSLGRPRCPRCLSGSPVPAGYVTSVTEDLIAPRPQRKLPWWWWSCKVCKASTRARPALN
jgi:hypothetical protein